MRVDALHYELPPDLIAQHPARERELARLMSLGPDGGEPEHHHVSDLADLVPEGALVVVNDTRVIPARLLGRKRDTGGRVELFLVHRVRSAHPVETREADAGVDPLSLAQIWRALGRSSHALKPGLGVEIRVRGVDEGPPALFARLLGRAEDDGLLEVALWTPPGGSVDAAIAACGHVPLPPYIKRADTLADMDRYQTIYARHDGAVAAPTAGLHITDALLDRLESRGCELARVTLHVGLGTFRPVTVEDLDQHPMHAERCIVSDSTVNAVQRARERAVPVVAVGTTTARALETAADPDLLGRVRACDADTRLLIQPGYRWRVVDGLFTNFHLPGSTLLAMVCALGGAERVLSAYRLAVRERYRFFSYGDAMLLWRRT